MRALSKVINAPVEEPKYVDLAFALFAKVMTTLLSLSIGLLGGTMLFCIN